MVITILYLSELDSIRKTDKEVLLGIFIIAR